MEPEALKATTDPENDSTARSASDGAGRSRQMRAMLALLAVTLIWGGTFLWMKQGVETTQDLFGPGAVTAGIGLFMVLRFGLAALLMPIVIPSSRRGLNFRVWWWGFLLGFLLLSGFHLQMFGLEGVSAPVSAFLTSLYVVFTALLSALLFRKGIGIFLWIGALLATFGAGYISGPPQLSFGLHEWLTVACAFLFAAHILAIDYCTKNAPPMPLTWTSFLCVALGSSVTLAVGIAGDPELQWGDMVTLTLHPGFWKPMLASSLLATLLALSLMNQFQREVPPVRAAILYAVEPVWAALMAVIWGNVQIDFWLVLGGVALLFGNLIAELGPLWKLARSVRGLGSKRTSK